MSYTNHQTENISRTPGENISDCNNSDNSHQSDIERWSSEESINSADDSQSETECQHDYPYLYRQSKGKKAKTYSERKQDLKAHIQDIFDYGILKHNLRGLNFPGDLEENWGEIRNMKVLITALEQIVNFIDNPTYKNLDLVNFLQMSMIIALNYFHHTIFIML